MSVHRGGRGPGHMCRSSGKPGDGAAVAFVPSSLFASSETGYAWDATDTSHLWQSIAGTTTVANTSVVGRVEDVSGNARHWNAGADDTTRPTWSNTSNNGLLVFTSANSTKLLNANAGVYAAVGATIIMAVKGASQATFMWAETSSSSSNPVYAPCTRGNSSTQVLNYLRSDGGGAISQAVNAALLDGAIHILTIKDSGTVVSVSVDGGAFVTNSYARSATTPDRASLGVAYCSGTYFSGFNGSIGSGIVIGRQLSGTLGTGGSEITNAYNWIAAKHGLTQL